ncbi:DUF4179 domain-containing protein [Lysinibacillus sp. NPDC097287]|uniref:DUF4179 domain-containing protein n=1 Tax=Lysinibacillus sp. NPDC097287 TaxID=3364144 RepID=UPI003826ADCA
MNKEKFNESIDNINVPIDKLMEREKTAILHAKKKRKVGSKTKRIFLVACGLCVSLLGSGFVSTGMAEALSNIPLIGPIYKEFRDIASTKIERDQLATMIDKQDSHNGLTMTVKEAAYDGNRLMVSLVYTGEKALAWGEESSFSYITINGQPVKRAISGRGGQDDIDPKTIIEHQELTFANYDEYGDKIEVAIHGENLFGYEGEWEVAFPLEKVAGEIYEFSPQVSAQTLDEVYTITAEKVTFTPLATRIDLSVDYPIEMNANDTWPWFEMYVLDDSGRKYEGLTLQSGVMPGNYGHHNILTLPPLDTIPESFTLKPGHRNSEGYLEEIKELELVIPLNKSK